MFRVIVERPRYRGRPTRKGRHRDFEALPAHEGMRRRHVLYWGGKELNENLAPLRRYLEGQVGRPWNKVYSEICAGLRIDNTVQRHVRDHLDDFVAVKPRRLDGWRQQGGVWRQPLYVDERDGLLKRTDRLRKKLRAGK